MTKSKKERKKTQLKIKKLVKKYPWLKPRNSWTGKIFKDYDYTWHELDSLGKGWWRAFGLMMCEEIQQELVKHHYVDKFWIYECKEKFGSARIYTGGSPGNVERIIDKYSYISQNVCWYCGKPDVAITNDGWILPICKDCFEKNEWSNRKYEEVIDSEADNKIPDTYTIRHYFNDETQDEVIDISDTVNEIRRQWQKRERKRSKARARRNRS